VAAGQGQEQTGARPASGAATLRPRVTEAITEAALAEVAESGYARLSMEAVARRAGVGKAALYRRWTSKEQMLTELIRDAVTGALPPIPATGALSGDLRELLTHIRRQLSNPLVIKIGAGLLGEAGHDGALADMLRNAVAAPRRAVGRAVLQAAIDRGELPRRLDVELGTDLLIAPLAFRMLVMRGRCDDDYLETLTAATEAAVKAATR
jgi:AcrR family transcriptional regulator